MVKDVIRQTILSDPGMVLEDHDMIQALLRANKTHQGRNIVDLRGVLIDRLEGRLDQLEGTHRDVVAAAYENLAGTHQIHRATLAILAPQSFDAFLDAVMIELPAIMALDAIRLCFEGDGARAGQALGPHGPHRHNLISLPKGGVAAFCGELGDAPKSPVYLRRSTRAGTLVYKDQAATVQSEAILKLDLGPGKLPGILVFGSNNPTRFHGDQGTDLLNFFGAAFSAVMQKWLA